MALNIKEITSLAERLSVEGHTKEADNIRNMIKSLAEPVEMGLPPELEEGAGNSDELLREIEEVKVDLKTNRGGPELKEKVQGLVAKLEEFLNDILPLPSGAVPVGSVANKTIELADSLDAFGLDTEAGRLDGLLMKLSTTMVRENDPEFEAAYKEEHGKAPENVWVGKEDKSVTKENELMQEQEMPTGLDNETRDRLVGAGWHIFEPGELEQWVKTINSASGGDWEKWLKSEREKDFGDGDDEVTASAKPIFEKLSDIADRLDSLGATTEASLIDGFIKKHADEVLDYQGEDDKTEQSKRYDSKHHHSLQVREPKTKQERVDREGREKHHVHTYQNQETEHLEIQKKEASLSTRYCPDHIGVMMGRVGESTYQCPIDGQVYNHEIGWTDRDGKEHPGGSIGAQTPDSSGYAIPHRIFDSRENILNRVN